MTVQVKNFLNFIQFHNPELALINARTTGTGTCEMFRLEAVTD